MHYLFLATTRNAQSSFDARCHVSLRLAAEGFVIDPKHRWSGGLCDWYTVGGRFTGELSKIGPGDLLGRDQGAPLGYDDDAMLVTPELYDRYLADHEEYPDESRFADFEHEPVTRAFIGTKWLVVVDYHR